MLKFENNVLLSHHMKNIIARMNWYSTKDFNESHVSITLGYASSSKGAFDKADISYLNWIGYIVTGVDT